MDLAVRVERLAKSYLRPKPREGRFAGLRSFFSFERERVPAVREIGFTIRRGEAVGFIGENGAGKSTTIKMLTGLLLPTSGRIETLGMDPWRNRRQLATNIGVVFGQKPQLLWDIPAGHSFELLKAMYAIPEETYRFTFRETVEHLELGELLKKPVRLLSLGQRMRCDLAASLLHAPAVAFLDEPTIGMDVLVKERNLTFLLMARPEVHSFGNLLSGSVVLGAAFYLAPPPPAAYFLLPLWLASGTLVYTATLVLVSCTSFFILTPSAYHLMLGPHLLNASRYPVSIYPKALQYVLLVALPLCVSAFVPGRWLQGGGALLEAIVAPPLAAAASVAVATFAFGRSLARYQSTGS